MRRQLGLIAILVLGLIVTPSGIAYADPAAPDAAVDQLQKSVREPAPQNDGAALPKPAIKKPASSLTATDCGKLAAATKLPAGKKYFACAVDGPAVTKEQLDRMHTSRLAAVNPLPLPPFCQDYAKGQWAYVRTQACAIFNKTLIIIDQRAEIVGTLLFVEVNLAYSSDDISTWGQQIQVLMYGGTNAGLLPDTTVSGYGLCVNACDTTKTDFPRQAVSRTSDPAGEAFHEPSTTGTGWKSFSYSVLHYTLANPAWFQIGDFQSDTPRLRCDNSLPGVTQVGCVFPDYTPVMDYSRNGRFPELARHIEEAQDSGLPGKYGTDQPLTRLTDQQKREENGNKACPRRYPRPDTKSCDEYPPRSSNQGASTTPNQGPARTFDWCSINEPIGTTGPNGYSSCMIDAWQNSVGGSALGSFYDDNRVLDQDPYFIRITTNGGGDPAPADHAPVANAGPDVTGFEGDRVTLGGSATDDNGPPAVQWSYRPGPDVDPGAVCFFGSAQMAATTIRCTDDGTYTVTLSASDGVQEFLSTDEATVRLSNVPPGYRRIPEFTKVAAEPPLGIVTPTPWQLFRVGAPVTLSTTYTDPGANDTQTCTIRWDDGSAVQSFAAADGKCERTHTFTHAGMYTITPGITDDDGGVAEARRVMVIVYDPAAGVASGNGWLNSAGDTGFDFTGSYPTRAATVPDGAVTYALPPAANLNLRNHQHLDWLVVTPDGKIAVKGTAERIPGQNVGFVLYGYYGCPAGQSTGCQPGPHRLRMVVWDSTANGPIPEGVPAIYDNRGGASFDVDEANPQNVSQGQLLIQHPPIG